VEFLLGGAGKAWKGGEAAAIAAVPAETVASAFEAVPADGGVHVVKQESIGTGQGVALGDQALAFTGFKAPDVDAFEIGVAIGEESDFDMESAGQFVEKEAQRFGQALVELQGGCNAREEVVLRGEVAAAVGQEGQGCPPCKRAANEADPSDDAHPADLAFYGGEQDQD